MMSPGRRRTVRWAARAAAGLVGALALATVVLLGFGLCDHLGEAEVGLVLGNKVEADGRASAHLQARLDKALELRRLGYFDWVIVSGGIDGAGHDEAAVMRDYLLAHGVPADKIIADNRGINTYESARHTVELMREHGWDGVCVVTHYFHVPRARLALGHFGANNVSSGSARTFAWRDIYSTARELVGYGWYACRHYDRPPRPPRDPGADAADHSTNNTPALRRAWWSPGRLTFAGPAAGSSRARTRSTSS